MKYYNLTTPQKNIWNLQKYYEDTAIGNICGAVFYKEKRDSRLLQQSIRQFVLNQSGLRLRFVDGKEPRQYVADGMEDDIPIMEFQSRKDFDAYAEECAREPIGLDGGPMYRFVVFQVEGKSGILVASSHLISDAWTYGLMANQFDKAYHKLLSHTEDELAEGDYVTYIQAEQDYMASARYEKDKAYWEGKYANRPEESFIKLHPVPVKTIRAKRMTRTIPLPLEEKVAAFCKACSVTEAVLFEAAVFVYLSKVNPENKSITIGVPVLNRSGSKEKKTAGMFIATMPLTVKVEDAMTVAGLASQITKGHMDLFRHQKYPYADLLKYLREKQGFSGNLYDVMVSYQNARTDTDAQTRWYSNGASEVPFALHIDNRDGQSCHTINVDYQTEVFQGETEVSYLIDRIEYVIGQMAEDPGRFIGEIDILPAKERHRLLYEFNDTAVDYPREKCVHELFTEQAQRTPERTALVFEERKFTYRQLDELSNSLAHFLREKGVKRNDVVPIIARRSWHVVVAMLGVLKAGGAYMPVSPDYPRKRIADMLEIARAKLALVYGYEEELAIEKVDLSGFDYFDDTEPLGNQNQPEDLCYVIFTSGSMGEPKGVSSRHYNVCNYAADNSKNQVCHDILRKGYRRIVSVTNIIFDIFVTESLLPLLNGLTVYFANEEEAVRQSGLSKLIQGNQIEVLQTTPTKMRSYLFNKEDRQYLKYLKVIILGGEAFPADLYHELRKHTEAEIYNIYGPAETTVWSSNVRVLNDGITIGRPIANTQIYILDQHQNLLPIGVAGELCIAGDGVGKGYLNRPELTAKRFLPNPFATKENGHGKTVYRTGDLARFLEDGEIEYLGRMDSQVKIRGLRIELGEIESVMGSFPGIRMCAVTDKRDEKKRQYLVGYYTAKGAVDERQLRKYLTSKLPKYMVPNYFVQLAQIPMTPSGKTDRKSLPVPDFIAVPGEYTEPVTEIEKRLASIWRGLLQKERIGRTEDFFGLGGDSLLVITMICRVEEEFQAGISVKDVMEHPVLEQLARVIDRKREEGTGNGIPMRHQDKYILLPQQKAVYAACTKSPETLAYNMPAWVKLPSAVDRQRLKECITTVLNHHWSLKTYISQEDDEVYGIYDLGARVCFEEYTNDTISGFLRPFDLAKAPLVRVGFTEDKLLFDMHHIIADGESLNIIVKDIWCAYAKEELSDSGVWYSDYAQYFREVDFAEHKSFFRKILKCDFEPLQLPERKGGEEAGGASKIFLLPSKVAGGVKDCARKNSLTETMLYFGAFVILLSKYSAKEDILTSVILSNRLHGEVKDVVGMFVNTLPVCLPVRGDIKTFFNRVRDLLLGLYEYQELPFLEIAKAVGMEDKAVVNTSFVYQADGEKRLKIGEQELAAKWMDTHTAKFDLSMEVTPVKYGCKVRLEYNCAKYDEKLIDSLFEAYRKILLSLTASETETIEEISVLSDAERNQLLYEFNRTAADYPRDKCVHEFFEEQVRKTPERTALVFEDKKFTYRQLDTMSNSLAHRLRACGVGRNDVVPIVARRSWHVVVAMLGVLKAGGAYMLIDYQYPAKRISYLVQECKSNIVLVYDCVYDNGKSIDLGLIDYTEHVESPIMENECDDILCAIHTSGSSGVPKVTVLTHRNIMHYIYASARFFKGVNQSIATTIITFDAFTQETIVSLCNQVPVILLSDIQMGNQTEFENVVNAYEDSFLFQTPTKLLAYMRNSKTLEFLGRIKHFIIGGEIFPQELYEKIHLYHSSGSVFNIYGPTETTICVAYKKIGNGGDITIGRPIANTQIYILDQHQNLLPIGVAGELCIAGDGVGMGYLNRQELTAERFLPNPFATKENGHGKTMYRTGDLARFLEDGEIEYLGRMDSQVKIRGLRIELGEIESVMGGFPGIRMCAVTDKKDEKDQQYLVGYYTAKEAVDERQLRKYLTSKLPKYMVPNYFVRLAQIPMTPSGKTDRKSLPAPDFTAMPGEYIEPETEIERRLASIWRGLLQTERIGKTEDFFELGGDSLLAITMISRVEEEFHTCISVKEILEHPTLEQLAGMIEGSKGSVGSIPVRHLEKYALLSQQKAIYLASCKAPGQLLYNIPARIPLPPEIDREKLKASIRAVVERHQSLKTYFSVEGDEIYGIYDASAEVFFEEYPDEEASGFLRPFDLGKAPLVRVGFTKERLLFDIHHIIADGESLTIMLKDILRVYAGEELTVPEFQFSDYAAYFAEADFTAHKAFFKELLQCEFAPMRLPEVGEPNKTGGRSKTYLLPGDLVKGCKAFAVDNGLTNTMLYLGAFGVLLSKYTAQDEVLTSVVLTNRQHKEVQGLVGMFVNTLPVYFRAKGDWKEYFHKVKELVLNLYEYQDLPFLEIAEAVGMEDKNAVNTSFIYQAGGEKVLELNGLKFVPEFVETNAAKFDLSMEITPVEDGNKVRLEYNLAKYDEKLIEELFGAYESILISLADMETETIEELAVLSDAEKNRLLYEFNYTAADYPRNRRVQERSSARHGLDAASPETEQEKLCCRLLEEILGYGPVGVEDDFFEIGGDSLRAIEYAAKLQDAGVDVLLQNIFDYPTVRSLCGFLEKGAASKIQYHADDFEKYRPLLDRNQIDPAFCPKKRPLGDILLTGATGFLGAHILDCLMREETGKIYCLVRSADKAEGEKRIREILRYYFEDSYEKAVGDRIIPVSGDIEREGLAQDIPGDVVTVIHAAASVKHYGAYSYFEKVNVMGTRHVLDYAKKTGARFIHISTLSVSGNSLADEFSRYRSEEEKHFAETSFYIGQPLNNVYIRSKFEAERAVLEAALKGMDAKIIRVGNLTNRASDYKFQPNFRQNAFLSRVKAALEFGLMPDYLLGLYSEFSPVDLTAKGVVKVSQYAGQQTVFHVYSDRPVYHDRLLEILTQLGIAMKVADQDSFYAALKNTMKKKDTEYIYEAFQNDMDDSGRLIYDTNIHIENSFTVWFLEQLGFRWNETDLEYIRGYIAYFQKLGFLKC